MIASKTEVFNFISLFGAAIFLNVTPESPTDRLKIPKDKNPFPDGALTMTQRKLYSDDRCEIILSLDNPRKPGRVAIMKTPPLKEKEAHYAAAGRNEIHITQQSRLDQQIFTDEDVDIVAGLLKGIGITLDGQFPDKLRTAIADSKEAQKAVVMEGQVAGHPRR